MPQLFCGQLQILPAFINALSVDEALEVMRRADHWQRTSMQTSATSQEKVELLLYHLLECTYSSSRSLQYNNNMLSFFKALSRCFQKAETKDEPEREPEDEEPSMLAPDNVQNLGSINLRELLGIKKGFCCLCCRCEHGCCCYDEEGAREARESAIVASTDNVLGVIGIDVDGTDME